ncbi:MAG: hypothetical protein ACP5VS_17115, partial [Desulfomonilaceae bacterium]
VPPTSVLSEGIDVTTDGEFYRIITQIQDIESMKINIQDCYRSDKKVLEVSRLSGQSPNYSARLDCELMNRVFGYLADTPEYRHFFKAYNSLIEKSNYRELCSRELFAEYMKFLMLGRQRLMNRLLRYLRTVPHSNSDYCETSRISPGSSPGNDLQRHVFAGKLKTAY